MEKQEQQTNLIYQKQLLGTLQKLVDFRTQLIVEAAIIANDAKTKEWPSVIYQIKQIKKGVEKADDENLNVIATILKNIESPILQLESNLALKNNFRALIEEQSMQEKQDAQVV